MSSDVFHFWMQVLDWAGRLVALATFIAVLFWPRISGKGWIAVSFAVSFFAGVGFFVVNMLARDSSQELHYLWVVLLRVLYTVSGLFMLIGVIVLRHALASAVDATAPIWPSALDEETARLQRQAMSPLPPGSRDLVAFLAVDGAAVSSSAVGDGVCKTLIDQMTKQCQKSGLRIRWRDDANGACLLLRLVQVDEGSQFLRYMIPFSSPAIVEVEGELLTQSGPHPIHLARKAHFSVFGGTGRYMTRVCASRIAGGLQKWIMPLI